MKKIIFSTVILITFNCFAQKSEVVQDSADKKEVIFSKSLAWAAKTWKSANDVVQLKDETAGTIIIKGGLQSVPRSLGVPAKGLTMTMVTINVKDGKAKISFEETMFKWGIGTIWLISEPKSAGQYTKWSESTLAEIDSLILSYKVALSKSSDF